MKTVESSGGSRNTGCVPVSGSRIEVAAKSSMPRVKLVRCADREVGLQTDPQMSKLRVVTTLDDRRCIVWRGNISSLSILEESVVASNGWGFFDEKKTRGVLMAVTLNLSGNVKPLFDAGFGVLLDGSKETVEVPSFGETRDIGEEVVSESFAESTEDSEESIEPFPEHVCSQLDAVRKEMTSAGFQKIIMPDIALCHITRDAYDKLQQIVIPVPGEDPITLVFVKGLKSDYKDYVYDNISTELNTELLELDKAMVQKGFVRIEGGESNIFGATAVQRITLSDGSQVHYGIGIKTGDEIMAGASFELNIVNGEIQFE